MEYRAKQPAEFGVTISLSIPVKAPELFKNKATDDLLVLLSQHPFDEFTIGELARQTDHTKPTVGRAVDALGGNDLVTEESGGNRRLISISRERLHVPEDPILHIPQRAFQKPAKAAVEQLREGIDNVLGIVLYGSVARGEADRRSDIDLWVLVNENRAQSQRTANSIVLDLEEATYDGDRYAYDIDVEEVSSVPQYTENIHEIVSSGIPLYETEEFETVRRLLLKEGGGDE